MSSTSMKEGARKPGLLLQRVLSLNRIACHKSWHLQLVQQYCIVQDTTQWGGNLSEWQFYTNSLVNTTFGSWKKVVLTKNCVNPVRPDVKS